MIKPLKTISFHKNTLRISKPPIINSSLCFSLVFMFLVSCAGTFEKQNLKQAPNNSGKMLAPTSTSKFQVMPLTLDDLCDKDFAFLMMSDTEQYNPKSEDGSKVGGAFDARVYHNYKTWDTVAAGMSNECPDSDRAYEYDGTMILGDLIYAMSYGPANNSAADCYRARVNGYGNLVYNDRCRVFSPTLNMRTRTYDVMGNHDINGQMGIAGTLYDQINYGKRIGMTDSQKKGPNYAYSRTSGENTVHFIAISKAVDDGNSDIGLLWDGYTYTKYYLENFVGDSGERVYITTHYPAGQWEVNTTDTYNGNERAWELLAPYNASVLHGHWTNPVAMRMYNDGTLHHPNGQLIPTKPEQHFPQSNIAQAYAEIGSYKNAIFQLNVSQAGGYHPNRKLYAMVAKGDSAAFWVYVNPGVLSQTGPDLVTLDPQNTDLTAKPTPRTCADVLTVTQVGGMYTIWPDGASRPGKTVKCETP